MNNPKEEPQNNVSQINEHSTKNHILYKILYPNSVCIFGANNNLIGTMGSMMCRNLISDFQGQIFPIHPNLEEVQGLKAYKNVLDLPEIPDLAHIVLPPRVVPQVLEECGQKGIKRAIIVSGGFRESRHADGVDLSQKIDEIAKKYNIRFIGPNCLGVYNGYAGLNTFWAYLTHKIGNISIASQSGTFASLTAWHTRDIGVKIGKSISVGNERNIDLVDVLEFYKDDPQTSVIGLYIEEIKRGKRFINLAKEITPKKPIVAIYTGGSAGSAASRSIKSHTGSIAGDTRIYDAMFKETGIISTDSVVDFLYYLRTLSYAQTYNIFPKGKRVGIITDSGGSGSLMTKLTEKYGLEVPEFSKELQDQISELIPPTASGANPVDITFFREFYNFFMKLPKLIIKSGEVDCILFSDVFDIQEINDIVEQSGGSVDNMMKNVVKSFYTNLTKPIHRLARKYSVPIFYSGPQFYSYQGYREFIDSDIPIFELWDAPPKCMAMLVEYSRYRRNNS